MKIKSPRGQALATARSSGRLACSPAASTDTCWPGANVLTAAADPPASTVTVTLPSISPTFTTSPARLTWNVVPMSRMVLAPASTTNGRWRSSATTSCTRPRIRPTTRLAGPKPTLTAEPVSSSSVLPSASVTVRSSPTAVAYCCSVGVGDGFDARENHTIAPTTSSNDAAIAANAPPPRQRRSPPRTSRFARRVAARSNSSDPSDAAMPWTRSASR